MSTTKKAIFVVSQKGGVGKTTFSRALLDYLRHPEDGSAPKASVAAYDGDRNIAQLADAYGIKGSNGEYSLAANESSPTEGVTLFDARSKKGAEAMAAALDVGADILLFDLPGGSVDDMKTVFGNMQRFRDEYEESGYEIWVIVVVNHLFASARNIKTVIDLWGPSAKYVVVKNLGQAEEDQFVFFDGAEAARAGNPDALLQSVGGQVIRLPALDPDTYAKIDADAIPFFVAAVKARQGGYLRPHPDRVKYFLRDVRSEIDSLGLV